MALRNLPRSRQILMEKARPTAPDEMAQYLSEVRVRDPKRPYSQDPMADFERDISASYNPFFDRAVSPKQDITEEFVGTLYQRLVNSRKNYIVTIKGPMGHGKSVAAMGIYKLMRDVQNLPYDAKHVLFTEEDLKSFKIQPRDTLIVDEDFRFGYGIGLTSLNNFIDFLNQTIRYEQVNIIYVGPEDQQSVAHRRLEILDYDTQTTLSRLLVRPSHEWAGMQYIGNIRIPGFVIPGYEKRKAEFTKKVLLDQVRSHNKALSEIALKLERENHILSYGQRAQKGIIRDTYGQLSEKQIEAVLDILIAHKARADSKRPRK